MNEDDEKFTCRRCRYEVSYPHPWCATIGCDCEECEQPDISIILNEIRRRWE